MMLINSPKSASPFERRFSFYDVTSTAGNVLNYEFSVFPNGIEGDCQVSFSIFVDNNETDISPSQISAAGFNPNITIIKPGSRVNLVNITFPNNVDLSNVYAPVIFTLSFNSEILISNLMFQVSQPDDTVINIAMYENSIVYHEGQDTTFRTSYPFANIVGDFTIQSIGYSLTNGSSGFFETIDLLSQGLPTTFTNNPSSLPNPTLPTLSQITYLVSETSIPLSWTERNINVFVSFGDYNKTLSYVILHLDSDVFGLNNFISVEKFPIAEMNKGASFNVSIDATVVQNYNCYLMIYSEEFSESLNVSCGQIVVYSSFDDNTPPQFVDVTYQYNYQILVSLQLSDTGSGISKVDVPAFKELYNNQKISGTDQSCLYQFYISATSSLNLTIFIYDFNHNVNNYTLEIIQPFSSLNITNYNPILNFDAPDNIQLIAPQTTELFFSFQDPDNCDYETSIFVQSVPLLPVMYTPLSNYQNIINGTACNGIIGNSYVYPQIRNVMKTRFQFLNFIGQYSSIPLYYTSIINAEEPYLDFQPVLLTHFSSSSYNVSGGDNITLVVSIDSITRIYSLNVTIVGLNQKFTYSLANTKGTFYVGEWSANVQVPSYANNGTYTFNIHYYTYPFENTTFTFSNIISKGYNGLLTVNSIVDLLPPSVLYVDTDQFVSDSQIMVRVNDLLSGVQSISMILTPNNITNIQDPSIYFTYYEEIGTPGNTSNIDIICTFNIPPYAYSGKYWMYFTVTDYAGNSKVISPDSLSQLSIFPNFVQITTSGLDNLPPTVTALTLTSNSITSFPQNIGATISLKDNLSGVNSFDLFLNGSGNTFMFVHVTVANRISGDGIITPNVYQVNFQFSPNLKPLNLYYVNIRNMIDVAGNSIDYPYAYLATITPSNKTISVNTGTTADTDLPTITSLYVSTNSIDLGFTPLVTSITVTATFDDDLPLQSSPVIFLQHSTQSNVPSITCQVTNINSMTYTYVCDVENLPTGYYYIHVKSIADQNGNFNSCFKCNSLLIFDSDKPLFGEYSSVPTSGGRAYFTVENFLNESSTKILVNGVDCAGFQYESYESVSCLISNGTGTLEIQGYSNGHFTNILFFDYFSPVVESSTSVLPVGGDVIIFGSNFGNSSSTSDISIKIGTLYCVPVSVNDTLVFCKLPAYAGSTVFRDIVITVDGLISSTGNSKFQYNDPPNTKCAPSETCSNNGQCISGICLCQSPWSGAACNQKTFTVPTNTNPSNPSVIVTPNSTNEDISTLMTVSVIAFNEINPANNKLVKQNLFKTWTYTQSSNSASNNYLYSTSLGANSTVTVLLQVFKTPATIQFAGQSNNIPANGMKYSINVTNYPWTSSTSVGQLIMKSELLSQVKDETFCSGFNKTEVGGIEGGSSDDIRWIKISQGNYTMYGKFSNRAVVDGRPTIINNVLTGGDVILGDQAASSSFIGVNVPHFYRKVEIDPDFSVLLNVDNNSKKEEDHLCPKSKTKKWLIPVIATIASVVGVALIVTGIILFKKYKLDRELTKSLSSHSR